MINSSLFWRETLGFGQVKVIWGHLKVVYDRFWIIFFPKTCDLHFMPFKNRSNKLTSMHDLTFAKLNKIRRCEIFCWLHTELSGRFQHIQEELKYLIKVKISNIQLIKVSLTLTHCPCQPLTKNVWNIKYPKIRKIQSETSMNYDHIDQRITGNLIETS